MECATSYHSAFAPRPAADLAAWLNATYGPGSWLRTPLGGWEPHLFELDQLAEHDSLAGWPPFSWEATDRWLGWIEETKARPSLGHDERQMWLLNALAVLEGRLAGTETIEEMVAAARAEMVRARETGAVEEGMPMLVDPPTPWRSMDEWLRFMASMQDCEPSWIQEASLAEACRVVLTKIAIKRAAEIDPRISDQFWLCA